MAVTPPNTPPNTANINVLGAKDTPVGVPLSGTDADGTVAEFRVVVVLPTHGVLKDINGNVLSIGSLVPASGNAANVTYVPNAGYIGVDSFKYASRDDLGLQDLTP